MKFVLRMAWRETRASAGRLLFFFLCVALGVASIVVLRSLMQNVRVTLTREARSFVGADLVIRSNAPWTPEILAAIDERLTGPAVLGRTKVIETQTMAVAAVERGTGVVRLVEIMAVGPQFPFYGTLDLEDGRPWTHDLVAHHGVVVPPELLVELGLAVGDQIKLGGDVYTVRAAVTRDRVQRNGGFSFGPRVYIDVADLETSQLLGFGSRAAYSILARVEQDALGSMVTRLRGPLRGSATVRDWRTLEDRLGRNLTIAENYLSLVGFAIVVLGGIGVWSVTRVVVQQKIRSVAILKCIGATSGRVLATYVLQMLWLALGGGLLGVGFAALAVSAIPTSLIEPLGVESISVTGSAIAQGLLVGILVSMLFALVPLLEIRRVKPLLLLRADTMNDARRRDWQSSLAWAITALALMMVAVWQADSLRAGSLVSLGLVTVAFALLVAGRGLVRMTRPLTRSRHFAVRHAIVSLGRPGNQTRVILMAVGLGCFFILAVRAVQSNLLEEFSGQIGKNAPDLVLIDIQQDQVEGVKAMLAPYAQGEPRLLPMMRGRVTAVEGRRTRLADAEAVRRHGRMSREYGITFRDTLEDNERLTAGRYWTSPVEPGSLEAGIDTDVSIEQQIHDDAGVDVGDVIRFTIAGQTLTTRVTSIRKVAWDDTQNGGFVFVLRPGLAVERTPHNFVGFLEASEEPAVRGALQRDLVKAYPNVSVIDIRRVLQAIREVVDNVTLGVTIVGAVTLVGGVLILVGAVAMTKFQRLYEAAIYRTLGASTRLLATMVAVEYGVLGMLAGALGALGALGLSWALARFLFDIPWSPVPGLIGAGVLLTAVTVCLVGVLASVDVLLKKPLATIRRE